MIWVANLLGSLCNYWTKKQKTGRNWLRGKTEKEFYYFCEMTISVTSLSSDMLIYIIWERESLMACLDGGGVKEGRVELAKNKLILY